MPNNKYIELLKDERVLKEIHKHLWIESEKAGFDKGLEWAAEDWLNKYANDWCKCNLSEQNQAALQSSEFSKLILEEETPANIEIVKKQFKPTKHRRAKYFFKCK